MNGIMMIFAAAFFLAACSGARAQRPDIVVRTDFGIANGYSLEDARSIGPSWNFGAGLEFGRLSVLASLGFDQFTADARAIADNRPEIPDITGSQLRTFSGYPMAIVTISADARYRLSGGESEGGFYLIGGGAFFRLVQDEIEITGTSNDTLLQGEKRNSFGALLGGGFELPIVRRLFWLYGETKFGAGIAGDESGFEAHYTSFRLGAEVKL